MIRTFTYRDAGVDLRKIRNVQQSIGQMITSTHRFSKGVKISLGFGHYAGLVKIGSELLALHSDGVGTKVLVAQMVERFDSIGIDCVAMNVNDVICVGARPVSFVDYIALKQPNARLVQEIMTGLVRGSELSDMAIVGGETAVLGDVISGSEETAFDLAGTVLGVVKGQPILGNSIRAGDIILGVESSGLHSNGYSLARKVLLSRYSLEDTPEHLVQTVGEELLVPTKIYVKPVLELVAKHRSIVHGLANITGGAFSKLARLNSKVDYILDMLPAISGIFKQIQIDGKIQLPEMYRTFNMGIGFCVIVPRSGVEGALRVFERHRLSCRPVGKISKGTGKARVMSDNRAFFL